MKTKKKNRIMSYLLTVCMLAGMLSGLTVSAADPITVESTHHNTNQGDGVVLTKTSTPNDDGTVTVSIGAYTTGEVKSSSTTTPTDIVLVLDVSGSMDDDITTSVISGYNEVYASSQSQWYILWTERWTGFSSTSATYYIDLNGTKIPLTYSGRDDSDYDYYTDGINYYYPKTSSTDTAARDNDYDVVQFYSATIESTSTQNRMEVLKAGAKAFIDTTAAKNAAIENDEDKHRIAIIKYANDNYYDGTNVTSTPSLVEGNDKDSDDYNYTQVVKGLTTVSGDNTQALKDAIDSLDAGGATAIDYGLNLATELLASQTSVHSANERAEAIIAFTDGEPNHSNGFNTDVANAALATAAALKSAGVTIYSISMADGANSLVLGTNNTNRFMHFLSSNYPASATSMSTDPASGDITKGYYMTPDGDHALESIFTSIMTSIGTPHMEMGSEAVLTDSISSYFQLEDGTNSIEVKTVAKTADGWADTALEDDSIGYTLSEDGKTIKVTGFDFDENYVSEQNRGTAEAPNYGKMLLLQMTIEPNNAIIDAGAAVHNGNVPTNADKAFLTDTNGETVAEVERPTLTLPSVTYSYTIDGANSTEHAKYYRMPNTDYTVIDAITKEGYTFSGWSQTGTQTMPNANVTITGNFAPNDYTVKYQYSGTIPEGAPAVPADSEHEFGSEVTVAAAPVVENYTFSGWEPLQTDVTVADGKFTMPAKEVTLVGHFVKKTAAYTVEHYLETLTDDVYETTPEEVEVFTASEAGTEVSGTPLNRFEGFSYNAEESAATASGTINENGTLVLKLYYDRESYPVTYGYDGTVPAGVSAAPATVNYKYGQTVTVEAKPTVPAGYGFVGWYRGTQDNPISGTFTMPAREVTILGMFTANTGTGYKVEHYKMDTEGSYPEAPDETENFTGTTGHSVTAVPITTFEGFTVDEDAEGTVVSGTITGDGSLVLKLYYERNKYKVTYEYERDVPDGAPAVPAEVTYYHGAAVEVEGEPSVDGYTFSGWHHDAENAIDISTGEFTMPMHDMVIHGYFTANTDTVYTVEHYVQNVEGTDYEDTPYKTQELEGTTDTEVTAVPIAIEGFTYNEADSADTKTGVIAGDGSLVLKLYYDRNKYKVTYAYEGDVPDNAPEVPAEEEVYFGADVTVAQPPQAPTGYAEFFGWYMGTATQDNIVDEFTMPARDVELLGYFVPDDATQYTVEHYLMTIDGTGYEKDDSLTETLQGTTGHSVTAHPLPNLTNAGFTYNEADSADTKTGVIAGDGSLVLKLYYERNKYKVTYEYERDVPDGAPAVPAEVTYYHGAAVEVEGEPSVDGYTFSGWHHDAENAIDISTGEFTMPMHDMVIHGYFTANTDTVYTVEHYVQNVEGTDYEDTPYKTQELEGTTDTEVTAVPIAIEGFTYNEADSADTKTGTIVADGSLVLKLYYDRNKYKVTYDYEGDVPENAPEAPAEEEVYFGADVTVAAKASAPVGYTFRGWYRGTYTNPVSGTFQMPARDVVILGNFQPNENTQYKVLHFLQNLDGSYPTDDADAEVTETLEGKTDEEVSANHLTSFVGFTYDSSIPGTVASGTIAGDGSLVLKLYYKRNIYTVTYGYEGVVPTGAAAAPAGEATYMYGEEVTVAAKTQAPSGYNFIGWYRGTSDRLVEGTFNMPAYNVHLLGQFAPDTDTPYRVEHYLQNEAGDGYVLDHYDTRIGTTGEEVSAIAREYPGFSYNEGISTPTAKSQAMEHLHSSSTMTETHTM